MGFSVDRKIDCVAVQIEEVAAVATADHHIDGNFAFAAARADRGLDFEPLFGFLESSVLRFAVTELAVKIDFELEMIAGKTHSDLAGTAEEIGWDVSPNPEDLV